MDNNTKVGLFGMYGLYNYGCEAIVRGTYELIQKTWPNCEVVLYTYCPKEDKEIIKDLNIIVKQVPMNKSILLRRISNKFLRTISIQKQFPLWNARNVADECDIIFSVGGDIYTIPAHIIENGKELRYNPIVEFGKTILKDKPFVIWGASIGPFGNKNDVNRYYFNHLKEVKQIFCREDKTLNYLKNNNIESNLQLCSDPAFYVKCSDSTKTYYKSNKLRIGLNLSPLSIREQIGEENTQFKDKIINTIKDMLTIPNTEIVLIPHVLSPLSENDNDLVYLKDIYNSIPNKFIKSVSMLDDAKGFIGTKEFLRTCDIVIAVRMHCAVNAVCEGVPTIFLTYSQKGVGMTNYIYGDSKWSVSLLNIESELKTKTLGMLSQKEIISQDINNRINEIRSDESRIVNLFKKLV